MPPINDQSVDVGGSGISKGTSVGGQYIEGGQSEGPSNGILLEDGSSFLLAENDDFIVQEV